MSVKEIKQNQVKGIVDSLQKHEKEPALAHRINCLFGSMGPPCSLPLPPSLGQHALLNQEGGINWY